MPDPTSHFARLAELEQGARNRQLKSAVPAQNNVIDLESSMDSFQLAPNTHYPDEYLMNPSRLQAAQARTEAEIDVHQAQAARIQQRRMLQAILQGQPHAGGTGPAPFSGQHHQQQARINQLAQLDATYRSSLEHAQAQAQAQHDLRLAQLYAHPSYTQHQYLQQVQLFQHQQAEMVAHLREQAVVNQRQAVAAKIQADLQSLAPRSRPVSWGDADPRAQLENGSVINAYETPTIGSKATFENGLSPMTSALSIHSPVSAQTPEAASTTKPLGRINSNPSAAPVPKSNLATFLSRRQASDEKTQARVSNLSIPGMDRSDDDSPIISESETSSTRKVSAQMAVGYGRPPPSTTTTSLRVASLPNPTTTRVPPAPRAVSGGASITKVNVLRQPYGPPGEAKDLGDRNFQCRIQRQAGLQLGMLGRRVESPATTPVLA